MTQVTLTDKGIGPIPYAGYNYYVMPANERKLPNWSGNSVDIGDIRYDVPTVEELNNVIYKNKDEIDAADTTISGSTSPSLANIGASTARDGSNTRETTWIWSSTKGPSIGAWTQSFSDGHNGFGNNSHEFWVVGIYKEPIETFRRNEMKYNQLVTYLKHTLTNLVTNRPPITLDIVNVINNVKVTGVFNELETVRCGEDVNVYITSTDDGIFTDYFLGYFKEMTKGDWRFFDCFDHQTYCNGFYVNDKLAENAVEVNTLLSPKETSTFESVLLEFENNLDFVLTVHAINSVYRAYYVAKIGHKYIDKCFHRGLAINLSTKPKLLSGLDLIRESKVLREFDEVTSLFNVNTLESLI